MARPRDPAFDAAYEAALALNVDTDEACDILFDSRVRRFRRALHNYASEYARELLSRLRHSGHPTQ